HADRINLTGRAEPQQFDKRVRAAYVTAACRKRLAEGSHPYVDLAGVDAGRLGKSLSRCAEHTEGMGLIDHQPCAVMLLERNETGQIRRVAVHRIKPFDDNQYVPVAVA